MNTKHFLIIILLFSFTVFAQSVVVPVKVSDSLKKLYPKATEVKWDVEEDNFEANFKNEGKEISVVFENDGEVIETETGIDITLLPKGIAKYVADNYNEYKIIKAANIVRANGEKLFEADINNGTNLKEIYFYSNGEPVKNDMNNEDEKKD